MDSSVPDGVVLDQGVTSEAFQAFQRQQFQQLQRIEDLERLVDSLRSSLQGRTYLTSQQDAVISQERDNSFFVRLFVFEERWVGTVGDPFSEDAADASLVEALFRELRRGAGNICCGFDYVSYMLFKDNYMLPKDSINVKIPVRYQLMHVIAPGMCDILKE